MKNGCFLDTNVLIYAAGGKIDEPRKFEIARALMSKDDFCLSAQVLAEFYVNVVKKYSVALTSDEIDGWMKALSKYPIAAVDADLVRGGVAVSQRYKISYWDAALIVAANLLEAPILYTEDLNHGQVYGSVTAINPFRDL